MYRFVISCAVLVGSLLVMFDKAYCVETDGTFINSTVRFLAGDVDEVVAKWDSLTPREKTDVIRIIRRTNLEEALLSGLREEYEKAKAFDDIFLIAEEIALEKYGEAFSDLPDKQFREVYIEAFSSYPDPGLLVTETICSEHIYTATYTTNDPNGAYTYYSYLIARVRNDPDEECDYELKYPAGSYSAHYVWGTTLSARALLALFGNNISGRIESTNLHLIIGYVRAKVIYPWNTESYLMQGIVAW